MRFSIGLWDSLFGERITIEIPTPDGKITKREVTKKWFERKQSKGKIKDATNKMIKVHLINPLEDYKIQYWAIGKDIDESMVNKFKDENTGDLYALISFDQGKQKVSVMKKEFWEKAKKTSAGKA